MSKLDELLAKRTEIDKQIEELKSMTGKRWRAEIDDVYFTIDEWGVYVQEDGGDGLCHNYRYSIGNYHQTEEQAIAYRERLIATQQIIDRIAELNAEQGWVADWGDMEQPKFAAYYCPRRERIGIDSWRSDQHTCSEFYGSEKTIKTVIQEMQPQIKLWLGVK